MHGKFNRWKISGWALVLMLVATVWSQAAPKPTDVVARIDDHPITVAEVQNKLNELGRSRPELKPRELKREAVRELVNAYLAEIRTRSIPVEDDTVFMRQADYNLNQVATQELFKIAVLSAVTVSDSEVADRYRQKPADYQQEAWVHAAHILTAPVTDTLLITDRQKESGWWAKTDNEAQSIADSLYRMIQAGVPFDSLARDWSQDRASGKNGGELDFFPPGRMVREFDSVAFRLPIGTVSRPVKTQYGFHLIFVFSRQERRTSPLSDSLKGIIRQQISNEKAVSRTYEFLDSLHRDAGLIFNDKIFNMADSSLQTERVWATASRFGDTVWSDRLAARLAFVRPGNPGVKADRVYKTSLLKELINPLLMRRAARDLKVMESDAYVVRKEQILRNERLRRVFKEVSFDYHPTEEEVQEYYRQHKSSFFPSESLSFHVQQMIFKTKGEAKRVFQEIEAGGDFALLARKYFPGDGDIAEEAFDLGFISPPAMPRQFFAVADTLAIGAVSAPVRTEWGYHLIRVIARRPDSALETVRAKVIAVIRSVKQEEQKRKWEAALREGYTVSINDQILRTIKYESSPTVTSNRP